MARTSNKSAEIKEQTADAEVETKTETVEATEPDTADSTPDTTDTAGADEKCDDINKTSSDAETETTVDDVVDNDIDDTKDSTAEAPVDDNIIVDDGPAITDNEVKIQFVPVNIVYPINAYAGPSESMLVGLVAGWMNVEVDTTSEFVHFEKAQGAGVICGYIRRSDIR